MVSGEGNLGKGQEWGVGEHWGRGGREEARGQITVVRMLVFPMNEIVGWGSLARGGSWDVAGSLGCCGRTDQREQVEQKDQVGGCRRNPGRRQ